jgi:2-hydroxycyclohexanecarboxyl-CoA dehydrogenase
MGSAIVARLTADGYQVAALDVDAERLRKVVEGRESRVKAYEIDLRQEDATRRLVRTVESDFGRIDVLVNTVGWTQTSRFIEESSDYWKRVIALNFEVLLYVTHAVLPGMIERRHGKIINIASDAAKVGQSNEAVYSGMKGAVVSWSKALARELARYGINVNCIAPGPTETPLDASLDQELLARVVRAIPFRRRAKPEEQAAAVAFLCSADSDYITGQTLSVNGGLTMVG